MLNTREGRMVKYDDMRSAGNLFVIETVSDRKKFPVTISINGWKFGMWNDKELRTLVETLLTK